jgi:hypothetical protein
MTITTTTPLTHTEARVHWSEVDDDLWVADLGGAFGGSIDSADGHHLARDPFGRERGQFETFEQARRHLEAFLAHPAMSRYLAGARVDAR